MNEAQAQRWNGDSGRRWVSERERHAAIRQPLLPHLWAAAAIAPGERVLDVGCGCGETSVHAAGLGATVTGVDFSGPMLAAAAETSVSNVEYLLADAQSHPFPEAAFDVVISSFGVMFFDDPAAAFANLHRSLRPGGRLAFLCWQPQTSNEIFSILMNAFGLPYDDPADTFYDRTWISDLLGGAGFAGVNVSPLDEVARVGRDVDDLLDYQAGSPVLRGFEGPLEPGFEALAAEYATRQRPDGVWVGVAAWLVTAHRP